jgi:hypothetical protein
MDGLDKIIIGVFSGIIAACFMALTTLLFSL